MSRLALGAMTFTTGNPSAVAKVDKSGAEILFSNTLDAGINFFDTADVYAKGQSEEILGPFLKPRAIYLNWVAEGAADQQTKEALSSKWIR